MYDSDWVSLPWDMNVTSFKFEV